MESQNELEKVRELIRASILLKEEDKPEMLELVETLQSEDLKKVRTKLEGEDNFILKAFGDSIEGTLNTDPAPELVKELKEFFLSAPKMLLKAREKDSQKEDQKDLESMLDNLPPDA